MTEKEGKVLMWKSELFHFLDGGLLRHVDAVEELADVLVLHQHTLSDQRARPRHLLDVVAREPVLVLQTYTTHTHMYK